MKKLLYLFLVLGLFACSDDEDNSNQTFLEKYDGVVWESPFFISNPQDEGEIESIKYIIFNDDNQFLTVYQPHLININENPCLELVDGLNPNGETYSITLNNSEALHLVIDNAESGGEFSIVEVTVTGDIMTWDLSYSNTTDTLQASYYRSEDENPCD